MTRGVGSKLPRPAVGYTLIELLMVLGVLGLAASLLIPYMVGRSSLETQAAVRMIIADLSFAQSDALAQQELRRVHFFGDGRGYCIIRIDPNNFNVDPDATPDQVDYIYDPMTNFGSAGKYIVDFEANKRFDGVSITGVSIDDTGNRFITYDQIGGTITNGGLPGSGGQITVSSDQVTYRIHVAPFTGKLTVEKVN